ncbi:MAG: RNA polymerase sigma factor (sigma-70 family) [Sphingobacteriales bacterium]
MPNKIQKVGNDELIELLSNRDEHALEVLYDNYSGALLSVVFKIVNSQEIAEDVLQEAFVKIWNSFESYSAEKGRLFTWMVNVTRNLAIDKVRSKDFRNQSKNQNIESNVFIIDNIRNTSYNPDHLGVKALLKNLKPEQQSIIELVYFKGYTHAEVSEELGVPLGTVKTRIRMGIIHLREYFEELKK